MNGLDESAALVLFSGGQDSTTCLGWALSHFQHVETIGFRYGQRHAVELEVRQPILTHIRQSYPEWANRLGVDRVMPLDLNAVVDSALLSNAPLGIRDDGLPNTFIPGRNLVFLTYAAIVAHQRSIKNIIIGCCETDFSGYPDCRDDTIKALQVAINLGLKSRLALHTPLMWIDKAATWQLAIDLAGTTFVNMIREETHTCYLGDRVKRHEWGYGCGTCDACKLRAKGWKHFYGRHKLTATVGSVKSAS